MGRNIPFGIGLVVLIAALLLLLAACGPTTLEATPTLTPTPTPASGPIRKLQREKAVPTSTVAPTPTPPCFGNDPSLQVLPALVEVMSYGQADTRSGSGFIVDSQRGYILTAYHVIANEGKIEVTLRNGATRPVSAVARQMGGDVALLQADTMGFPALSADRGTSRQGDWVYALGVDDGAYVTRQGILDGFTPDISGHVNALLSFAIAPGMSGGPLVDACGYMIGVNSLTHVAIAVDDELLRGLTASATLQSEAVLAAMPAPMRGLVELGFTPAAARAFAKTLAGSPEKSFGAYILSPVNAGEDMADVISSLVESAKGFLERRRTLTGLPVAPVTTVDAFRYLIDKDVLDPNFNLLFYLAETLPADDVIGQVARRAITERTPEALETGLRAIAAWWIQRSRAR